MPYIQSHARLEAYGGQPTVGADITYIRFAGVVPVSGADLDAYSRRVIGWALEETLAAQLTVKALQRALADRPLQAPLVHHSDRD